MLEASVVADQPRRSEYHEIYSDLRSSLYSFRFLSNLLKKTRRESSIWEFLLLGFSSGGFVAALNNALLTGIPQRAATAVFTALALAIAAIKSLRRLEQTTENVSRLVGEHHALYVSLCRLAAKIEHKGVLSKSMRDEYKGLRARFDALQAFDHYDPNPKTGARIQNDVDKRHPVDSFFWPPI